jgi:hypothetical protein
VIPDGQTATRACSTALLGQIGMLDRIATIV